jgi:hypothetical protein
MLKILAGIAAAFVLYMLYNSLTQKSSSSSQHVDRESQNQGSSWTDSGAQGTLDADLSEQQTYTGDFVPKM